MLDLHSNPNEWVQPLELTRPTVSS